LLPFRKLKFSVKLYVDQNVQKSVKKLQSKFGLVTVLILGDWSAPNTKYQEPTRNKGLIKMLKKNETAVYMINEFRTSFVCPICENKLEKFKVVTNLRPYKRQKRPNIGLWNHDLAATFNFLKILQSLRNTDECPAAFRRNN
ncbi:hypothetical protein BDF21DRAFT_350545, partial [Thamnidium elegans]